MAKLRNTELFSFDFDKDDGGAVGHNRFVTRSTEGGRKIIRAHLQKTRVAKFIQEDDGDVTAILCCGGWLTTTTINAINEFVHEMGLGLKVSRAKGKFSVYSNGELVASTDDASEPLYVVIEAEKEAASV